MNVFVKRMRHFVVLVVALLWTVAGYGMDNMSKRAWVPLTMAHVAPDVWMPVRRCPGLFFRVLQGMACDDFCGEFPEQMPPDQWLISRVVLAESQARAGDLPCLRVILYYTGYTNKHEKLELVSSVVCRNACTYQLPKENADDGGSSDDFVRYTLPFYNACTSLWRDKAKTIFPQLLVCDGLGSPTPVHSYHNLLVFRVSEGSACEVLCKQRYAEDWTKATKIVEIQSVDCMDDEQKLPCLYVALYYHNKQLVHTEVHRYDPSYPLPAADSYENQSSSMAHNSFDSFCDDFINAYEIATKCNGEKGKL